MFWHWFVIGAGVASGILVVIIPVLLLLSAWGLRIKERSRAGRLSTLSPGPLAKRTNELLEELKKMKGTIDKLKEEAKKNQPVGH